MAKSKTKAPFLDGLRSTYILPNDIRSKHALPDEILRCEAGRWKNVENLINSYFDNAKVPVRDWKELHLIIMRSLVKLSEFNSTKKSDVLLTRYATKVKLYINCEDTRYCFKESFSSSLQDHDLKTSRNRAINQGRVTGNMLSIAKELFLTLATRSYLY